MNLFNLDHVYFCTGARNQEILDFFNHDKLSFEIDERSASFKALGQTKVSNKPIAVCTTSGTAVSECLSAMLEAYYGHLPLLLITGDRPKRMHGKGCPQTIDHEKITIGARQTYIEIGLEELGNLDLSTLKYPAHINVLIEKKNEIAKNNTKNYESSWEGFSEFIKENPSPLILISHENTSMKNFTEKMKSYGLPIYAEILSQAHTLSSLRFEKDLIKAFRKGEIRSVIRIGHTPLTKFWRLLEEAPLPQFSFDERGLLGLSHGTVFPMGSNELMVQDKFWNILKDCRPFSIRATKADEIESLIVKYPHSDQAKMAKLEAYIEEDSFVYLGNSLAIRFFEQLNTTEKNHFFGSRGVNGIDGQISTAIGLAKATSKKVYCILGDLTTIYDLSAIRDIPENLKLIIINNSGGRIFQTLKLNEKIILEHDQHFEHIANAFNISYARNNYDMIKDVQILELITNPAETMRFLEEWDQ